MPQQDIPVLQQQELLVVKPTRRDGTTGEKRIDDTTGEERRDGTTGEAPVLQETHGIMLIFCG